MNAHSHASVHACTFKQTDCLLPSHSVYIIQGFPRPQSVHDKFSVFTVCVYIQCLTVKFPIAPSAGVRNEELVKEGRPI